MCVTSCFYKQISINRHRPTTKAYDRHSQLARTFIASSTDVKIASKACNNAGFRVEWKCFISRWRFVLTFFNSLKLIAYWFIRFARVRLFDARPLRGPRLTWNAVTNSSSKPNIEGCINLRRLIYFNCPLSCCALLSPHSQCL